MSKSTQAAIARMLRPRSIAIVGASPTPGSLGGSVFANLERFGFTGEIHLINPNRAEINGPTCPTASTARCSQSRAPACSKP